jgi:PAS domain S-box-containing protein/diguanylate cyclase (GGDEF)-like protein
MTGFSQSLVGRLDVVLWEADCETLRLTFVSDRAEELLGYPLERWLTEHELRRRRDAVAGGAEHTSDLRLPAGDGRSLWFREIVRVEPGAPGTLRGIMIDVTALREAPKADRALAASEAVTDGILQSSLDSIITMDAAGHVLDFNPAAERTFGYSRDEAVGRELGGLLVPEHLRGSHRAALKRHLATGESQILDRRIEVVGMRADGSEFPVELTVTRIDVGDSPVFAAVLRDLTEQRQAQEQMQHLATRDQLTGLPNRRLLLDHLDVAIARVAEVGGAVGILHVDLNRFGMVNESLGRTGGDDVLRSVAARLDALPQARVVARDADDEFLLVVEMGLHGTGGAGSVGTATARAIAAVVVDAVAQPLDVDGRQLQLGAHVGVSMLPGDAGTRETLLEHAEVALRQGQRSRVGIQLFEGRAGDGEDRLSFVTDLRGALDRDEFELHYQPIVNLSDREVVGVEALIRWRHPERGLVPPNDFIPVLEDSGLIGAMGGWVVAEALAQAKAWQRRGLELEMSVNLSFPELASEGITDRLVREAGSAGVDPSSLVVEITETTAMTDPDRIAATLHEIAHAGFRLAIDDFGTGHSSLARLWRLPVTTLKIDRSFTAAMLDDQVAGAMVITVIRLAEGLGIRTIGEGIETEEQLSFLVEQGCALGQGYLFSRALPAADASALLLA